MKFLVTLILGCLLGITLTVCLADCKQQDTMAAITEGAITGCLEGAQSSEFIDRQ